MLKTSTLLAISVALAASPSLAADPSSESFEAPSSSEAGLQDSAALGAEQMKAAEFARAAASFKAALDAGDNRFETLLSYATALAASDQTNDALASLHRLLNRGYNPVSTVKTSPLFASVRSHPEFEALRQRLEPCRGGAFDLLSFSLGNWEVRSSANADNKPDYSRIDAIADGCAIVERYWTDYGYQSDSFKVFDKRSNRWKQTVVDNQGFYLEFVQVPSDDGLVLEATDADATYRMSWTQMGDDSFQYIWLQQKNGSEDWKSYVNSTYTRVMPKP